MCQKSSRSQRRMGFLHEWVEGYYYCFTFLFLSGRCNNQNQSRVTSCPLLSLQHLLYTKRFCSANFFMFNWSYTLHTVLNWILSEFRIFAKSCLSLEIAEASVIWAILSWQNLLVLITKAQKVMHCCWSQTPIIIHFDRIVITDTVAYITNFTSGNPLSVLNVL